MPNATIKTVRKADGLTNRRMASIKLIATTPHNALALVVTPARATLRFPS
jgi:hypothetical protein